MYWLILLTFYYKLIYSLVVLAMCVVPTIFNLFLNSKKLSLLRTNWKPFYSVDVLVGIENDVLLCQTAVKLYRITTFVSTLSHYYSANSIYILMTINCTLIIAIRYIDKLSSYLWMYCYSSTHIIVTWII